MKSIILVGIVGLVALIGCGGSDFVDSAVTVQPEADSAVPGSGGAGNDSGTTNVPDAVAFEGSAGSTVVGVGGGSGAGGSGGINVGGASGTGGNAAGAAGTGVGGDTTAGAGGAQRYPFRMCSGHSVHRILDDFGDNDFKPALS